MKQLIKKLNEASKAYYIEGKEILSDYEYDKLYDKLLEMEKETGIVLSNSPTQKVGYIVLSELKKVEHKYPMLSLDKTKEVNELVSFINGREAYLSWKLDGLTIILEYNEGNLIKAVTRGNGIIGEDVTHNAFVFENIPNKINYKGNLIVRGEAVIPFKIFEEINKTLDIDNQYKNPRNLCSGTVRQLNNEVVKKRKVTYYAFQVVNSEDFDFDDKKTNSLKWLKEQGFDVVEYTVVDENNISKHVLNYKNNIENLQYGTDGLVLTFNSYNYSKILGKTSKFPKDSIAFKWADELATTKLLEVIWNTSRTGVINPVAVFEKVELEGTTVNKASLHNISIIEKLALGIGDTIKVYKANMIIPQIAENITKSNSLQIPEKCPACYGDTKVIQLKDGKSLYCMSNNCVAKLIDSIVHFVSRNAINIEGFSEATVEKFVSKGFLNNIYDIYNLEQHKDEIINMEGFGEKSYNKLIEKINKSKTVNLPNFIFGLGIHQVGLQNAKLLVKKYKTIDNIIKASKTSLSNIEGFGEVIANNVVLYFENSYNIEVIEKLTKILKFETEENKSNTLENVVVVITGSLNIFENRKSLQNEIESNGGKVSSSVSKNTNYLINNDNLSNSSKNKKAKQLNVEIITEEDFVNKFLK